MESEHAEPRKTTILFRMCKQVHVYPYYQLSPYTHFALECAVNPGLFGRRDADSALLKFMEEERLLRARCSS